LRKLRRWRPQGRKKGLTIGNSEFHQDVFIVRAKVGDNIFIDGSQFYGVFDARDVSIGLSFKVNSLMGLNAAKRRPNQADYRPCTGHARRNPGDTVWAPKVDEFRGEFRLLGAKIGHTFDMGSTHLCEIFNAGGMSTGKNLYIQRETFFHKPGLFIESRVGDSLKIGPGDPRLDSAYPRTRFLDEVDFRGTKIGATLDIVDADFVRTLNLEGVETKLSFFATRDYFCEGVKLGAMKVGDVLAIRGSYFHQKKLELGGLVYERPSHDLSFYVSQEGEGIVQGRETDFCDGNTALLVRPVHFGAAGTDGPLSTSAEGSGLIKPFM
jgi:hypothetical protein